jgi:hypothetical protein
MNEQTARFVVDRREGSTLVIEAPDGGTQDVPASALPAGCRAEGAVLDVPMIDGAPQWSRAKRNRHEERRILEDLRARAQRRADTDAGGDVKM